MSIICRSELLCASDIRAIEIFVRVVEGGSFVAAARSLLIDPAAVSRAIAGLEESMGILLFTRSTRVLKLTAEGTRFYRDAAQMLSRFEETIGKFQVDTAAAPAAQSWDGTCP